MKIIRAFRSLGRSGKTVATVGSFDGVHIGHQRVLRHLVQKARSLKKKSAVLTFEDHPQVILAPQRPMPLLVSTQKKLDLLKRFGVDRVYLIKFTRSFYSQTPLKFVRDSLLKRLGLIHLVVGYDFCFGRNRSGNTALLRKLSRELNFGLTVVGPVRREGKPVSSTRIRRLIERGDFKRVTRFLGRPFLIEGKVVRGSRRGKDLGYPTANISIRPHKALPLGVYAARALIANSVYNCMINVGWRPTFVHRSDRPQQPIVEAHLFEFNRPIYGRKVTLEFLERIRSEKRFKGAHDLKGQLVRDEARARRICSRVNARSERTVPGTGGTP